jgi:hypothetical protein
LLSGLAMVPSLQLSSLSLASSGISSRSGSLGCRRDRVADAGDNAFYFLVSVHLAVCGRGVLICGWQGPSVWRLREAEGRIERVVLGGTVT